MITHRVFAIVILVTFGQHTTRVRSDNSPDAPAPERQQQFDALQDQLAMESSDQPSYVRVAPPSDYNSQAPQPFERNEKVQIGLQPGPVQPLITSSWDHTSQRPTQEVIGNKTKQQIDSTTQESIVTPSSVSPYDPTVLTDFPLAEPTSSTKQSNDASESTNLNVTSESDNQNAGPIVTVLGRTTEVEDRLSNATGKFKREQISDNLQWNSVNDSTSDGKANISERIFTIIDQADADLMRSDPRIDHTDGSNSNGSIFANASFVEVNGSDATKPCSITIINYIYSKDAKAVGTDQDPEIAIVDHVDKNRDDVLPVHGRPHTRYSTIGKTKLFPKKVMQPKNSYIKRTTSDKLENIPQTIVATVPKEEGVNPALTTNFPATTTTTTSTYRSIPATSRYAETTVKPDQLTNQSVTPSPSYPNKMVQLSGSGTTTSSTRVAPPRPPVDRYIDPRHRIATAMHPRPPPIRMTQHPQPTSQAGNNGPAQQQEEYYTISASQLSRLFASNFMRQNMLQSPGGHPRLEPGFGNSVGASAANRQRLPASIHVPQNGEPQSEFEKELAAGFADGLRTVMRNRPAFQHDLPDQMVAPSRQVGGHVPFFRPPPYNGPFSEHFIVPAAANSHTFQHHVRPNVSQRPPLFNFQPHQQQRHLPTPWQWQQQNRPREVHYVIRHNQESDD